MQNNISIPNTVILHQNQPNPFNPITNISFQLSQSSNITLDIYDYSGQHICNLDDGMKTAGIHNITWKAEAVPSGIYFCTLSTEYHTEAIKMLLLR